jgi:hypothetical protein
VKLVVPVLVALLAIASCSENRETSATEPQPADTTAPGPSEPLSQAGAGPIPVEFRGAWAIEPADCTRDPGLTRIAVSENGVAFYEGRSAVVTATVPHEGALTMEVDHTAEGQTARETHNLALDSATGKLTYNRRSADHTYSRCA